LQVATAPRAARLQGRAPGFYLGGNLGGGWENTQTDYSYASIPAPAPPGFQDIFGPGGPLNVGGLPAVASAIAQGFLPVSLGSNRSSFFTAGGQIGYNIQINHAVLGVEADINGVNNGVRTTGFVAPPNAINLTNVATSSAGLRWIGTVRARLGWAADRALFYVTGGWAYGKVDASSNAIALDNGTNPDVFAGSASANRSGYAVGGGLEYALTNNITVKGEYLYYNLGTATYAVAPANTLAAGEGLFINASQKFDGSVVRLGLNYKFGNYYTPVVTK
jgi:outer membrane immunogenic protein